MNFNGNIPLFVHAYFFQNASNCLWNPFRSLSPGLYFIVAYFYLILYVQKICTTPPTPQLPPPKTENTLLDTVSFGILHMANPCLTLFKHS